ncbi:MAG: hypothetical protein DDT23_00015 [candidate division WS2 bacterium]|nr:hypothetical protein [Candidatus Lithacetigena glycinireducens]
MLDKLVDRKQREYEALAGVTEAPRQGRVVSDSEFFRLLGDKIEVVKN